MRYFNGFSLKGEEHFFDDWLPDSDLCVAGFSYGAQQALEYVYTASKRVDRLILLSPAFFQMQKSSFIRAQLRYFEADKSAYTTQFLQNAAYPSAVDLNSFLHTGTQEELEALLTYRWEKEKIEEILKRGTQIEVFLGSDDKIIDAEKAFAFFSDITTCYRLKGAGHLLLK
ncbi:hypothetical protein YH65_05465 [Sulfurovum lithotrophicum]|uniref:AB hydrolase-1 domain-containing protein n=1 Tax=Sulfurovum lithotrophicum TaxID=206403 RepID=A0A7U4RQH7_9BACT|nr:pimelyl-ACP methyl ester esterase BioV [Sulfurovum lithotrophicum]AKF24898.1 hypothetical protein YH65_05465 [Sulfurovum lithotrophicum]